MTAKEEINESRTDPCELKNIVEEPDQKELSLFLDKVVFSGPTRTLCDQKSSVKIKYF